MTHLGLATPARKDDLGPARPARALVTLARTRMPTRHLFATYSAARWYFVLAALTLGTRARGEAGERRLAAGAGVDIGGREGAGDTGWGRVRVT